VKQNDLKRVSLECASRVGSGNGDVRKVLDNAALFEAWLKGDTTQVAYLLSQRFG